LKTLFLYLSAFSSVGGIQKFNRSLLKALHELSIEGITDAAAISSHDHYTGEKYFAAARFKGFKGNRLLFLLTAIIRSFNKEVIIIGHINLSIAGCLIKRIFRKKKIILVVHGIEVWKELKGFQKEMVTVADVILSVSAFTKSKLTEYNPYVQGDKIKVFHNTIDPWFGLPSQFEKPAYLIQRYGLRPATKVLLTITRLSASEKYKGYDVVMESLPALLHQYPDMVYLLAGKADDAEKARVDALIQQHGVSGNVQYLGYIEEKELNDHYLLADVFVMPSKGEGFGIVFIEAMACGSKVIAGNADGSSEALANGLLGTLVDPNDSNAVAEAVRQSLQTEDHTPALLQEKVLKHFGFDIFKQQLKEILIA
jgi:phosphatidylinositol alpha-1,6-mannosyltransferase